MKHKLLIEEQKKKILFQNNRMLKLAGLIKENINEEEEQRMGILDDIDNDIENSDMDEKDCVLYLEDIITYCQKLKKEYVEKTYDDVLSKDEVDENRKNGLPSHWKKKNFEANPDDVEIYGGEIVDHYSSPMEGWDTEHTDDIMIIKLTDGKFKVESYASFGDNNDEGTFATYEEAKAKAIDVMEDFNNFTGEDD